MSDTPSTPTNAARRLYNILVAIKNAPAGPHIGHLFQQIFNLHSSDLAGLYSRFASLIILIDDVENRIKAMDDARKSEFLLCFEGIKKPFQTLIPQNSVDNLKSALTPSDLGLLKLAALELDRVQHELLIPARDVNALTIEVTELFKKIALSDLQPEAKIIVLDLLEAIRRTLSEYQIRGAEGLKRVLAECMGRLVLDKDVVIAENKKPEMKSFIDLLSKLNTIFTAATNSQKIGAYLGEVIARLNG